MCSRLLCKPLFNQRVDHTHSRINGGRDRLGKSHPAFPFAAEVAGLAAHQHDPVAAPVHRCDHAQNLGGIKFVGVEHQVERIQGLAGHRQLGFDDVEGTGRARVLIGVDQHRGVVSIQQRIDEIDAVDAEVHYVHMRRPSAVGEPLDYFHAKGVVALEHVAEPGDQPTLHALAPCLRLAVSSGSISWAEKKNRCPGMRSSPKSRPGSSSTITATCTFSSKSHSIASITATLPTSTISMISAPPLGCSRTLSPTRSSTPPTRRNASCGFASQASNGLLDLSLATGRSCRKLPCSLVSCSAVKLSVRSRSCWPRGSVAAISRFSSSVMARMRKERISSISVPSNKSPGLSGAISG